MNALNDNSIKKVLEKDTVSILVTDSGFGGLSICADVVSRLKQFPLFKHADITYFNAWPDENRGYNKFHPLAERIRIFDQALIGMQTYEPDLIMIACNTLSALYPKTEFSRGTDIPVLGIIEFGVDLIHEKLVTTPDSNVLVMGTMTMIAENRHKEILIERGMPAECIITQACDGLPTAIEENPEGEAVNELTDRYIREAVVKIGNNKDKLFVALCCTHFGYIESKIMQKTQEFVSGAVEILNPNSMMAGFLFQRGKAAARYEPTIDIKVVSKVTIKDSKIEALSKLIHAVSPETAEALSNYKHLPELFIF